MEIHLKLYAVQNSNGQWFKSKGYNGYGKSWVDSLESAKIYTKKGSARSQVTFWANHYPEYGIPKLIELQVTDLIDLKEDERVKKAMEKKRIANEKREIRYQEWLKESAEIKIKEGLQMLKDIENKK